MIEIKSAKSLALRHGIKAIVYGDAGTGKTSLAKTLTAPLVLSAENGLLSLADSDVDCVEIKTLDDMQDAFQFITESGEAKRYQTIVLDSVSEIAEKILASAKSTASDVRQAYGVLIDDVTELIKGFRDLSQKNVVLICKEEVAIVEDTRYFRPSLPGSRLPTDLPYLVDLVLRLHIDHDGETRILQTQPDGFARAKDRTGALDKHGEPADLQACFKKIWEHMRKVTTK